MSNLPQNMRYVEITQPGPAEVLAPATTALPAVRAGEVLVKVVAAGVNRPDVMQRKGLYPPPPDASPIIGLEIAGRIAALGEGVTGWRIGDPVCALANGGGYAEYCAVPAGQCLPVPNGLSFSEAAALPETYFTVWSNLFEQARMQPGETLLVQGGTSGIGVAAVQIASALGHRVFTTAGSPEKCEAAERLGAARAVNYRTEDFVEVVKGLTDDRGVDVVLDMVGGDYVARELKLLALDGRLVLIALQGGSKATIPLSDILMRRLTLTGTTLRRRSVDYKALIAAQLREKVWPLLESGRIKPVIHAVFPLDEAARAHELMESSTHIGKIVLHVGDDADI